MPRPLSLIPILVLAGMLAACVDFPDLDAAVSEEARRAAYPELVPVGQILARRSDGRLTEATGPALQSRAAGLRARAAPLRRRPVDDTARIANLRARADLLRGQPIDDETRLRLQQRLRRLGG